MIAPAPKPRAAISWSGGKDSYAALRRTVATFLTSELGVSRLVVSKLLNHVETGVTKVYDRASYDREKRQALDVWAVHLLALVEGKPSKVVPMKSA